MLVLRFEDCLSVDLVLDRRALGLPRRRGARAPAGGGGPPLPRYPFCPLAVPSPALGGVSHPKEARLAGTHPLKIEKRYPFLLHP